MSEKTTVDEIRSAAPGTLRIIDIRKKPHEKQIPHSERYSGEDLANARELPFEKDENVVLYCGSGNSCSVLAEQLRGKGYRTTALDGGYAAWKDANLPLEDISEQREV